LVSAPRDLRSFRSLAEIEVLERPALVDLLEELFSRPPPTYLSIAFIRRALGYEWQCLVHGGLPVRLRRELLGAKGSKQFSKLASFSQPLAADSELVREWNGRTYRVAVLEDGYRLDEKTYPSLTAVARRITGANWSGPRFFGLVSKSRKERQDPDPQDTPHLERLP
jgi:hypothetical protein